MIKRWLQEGNPRQRITELEAQVAHLIEENTKLRELLTEANTALDDATIERDKYKLQLAEATAPKPKRTSRAKPPAQE